MTLITPPGFAGMFRTDSASRAVYSEGAGIAREMPLAVAVPRDASDVSVLVRWAAAAGVPLIPRGSGSGMAGGAIGVGVIVDLSRLRALGAVDTATRTVRAEAGVLRAEVDAAARVFGLRFPVDPSSGAFCTVGGMVATNAAGAHTLRFGATRAWVNAIECVFADGSTGTVQRGETAPVISALAGLAEATGALRALVSASPSDFARPLVRKESSGYGIADWARTGDIVDLLVGSEGTLALITAVELLLAPAPGATSSILAAFPSLETAAHAATIAREHGASACELLDRTFLDVAAESGGIAASVSEGVEAVLLAECEGDTQSAATVAVRALAAAFELAGACSVSLGLDPVREFELWELRHAASPALARLAPELASVQVIEDSAVPPERLPEYVRGVRAALDARRVRGVIFGHAGDGNVHVNPLVDMARPDWRETLEGLLEDVVALTERLGGTLTGEHGDGRLRAPAVRRLWSPTAVDAFERVKACFDPDGILNPGAKLSRKDQRAINDVKYDPALQPLPAAARQVLDQIARERAYSGFRLEMLDSALAATDAAGATEG